MGETTAITNIATLMAEVVAMFSSIMEMVGDVAAMVIANPLVLAFCIVSLSFVGINMFRRFLNL